MINYGNSNPITAESNPLRTLKAPTPIAVTQVQTTATTVFTARDDADFQIESLIASNVTGSADWITVHMVSDGGSASTANTIVYQRSVPANLGIVIFDRENQGLLQPGYSLIALCNTNNAINVYGYGFDYQGAYGA